MAETIFIKYYEDTDCLHGYGVERTVELKRQEAIERMAKAYCSLMWGDRYSWEEVPDENKKYFYNFATVGLNALLEGK